jgi:hypothetical protein
MVSDALARDLSLALATDLAAAMERALTAADDPSPHCDDAGLGFGPADVFERFAECPALSEADVAALARRYGVPAEAIRPDPEACRVHGFDPAPHVRRAGVMLGDGGVFDFPDEVSEFDERPVAPALVMLAVEDGIETDIVAWPLAAGAAPATWLGRADMLGADALREDGPARAFRTPLDWLRAGRRGLVVLDVERARWRLAGRALAAQDAQHGVWLRDALALPRPQIMVAEAGAGRAA